MGFRNFNRSGFEAAHQSALKMFARIQKEIEDTKVNMNLEVTFKGFGKGRDAVFRALIGVEGYFVSQLVTKLTDRTPIKIGGTKSKKRRVL
jgi:small subunit ribosomal protein S11